MMSDGRCLRGRHELCFLAALSWTWWDMEMPCTRTGATAGVSGVGDRRRPRPAITREASMAGTRCTRSRSQNKTVNNKTRRIQYGRDCRNSKRNSLGPPAKWRPPRSGDVLTKCHDGAAPYRLAASQTFTSTVHGLILRIQGRPSMSSTRLLKVQSRRSGWPALRTWTGRYVPLARLFKTGQIRPAPSAFGWCAV